LEEDSKVKGSGLDNCSKLTSRRFPAEQPNFGNDSYISHKATERQVRRPNVTSWTPF